MIFVDASALVSILAREADAFELFAKIEAVAHRFYSAVSRWETIAALCRSHRFEIADATLRVDGFLEAFAFDLVTIGDREGKLATLAYERYGRGRHPAALNMGDCFAYACAKSRGVPLLYKGKDFAKTDLA